jgi:predicted YcjX-like family ATPase
MIFKRNHFEIIDFIYLCMLSIMATRIATIGANEEVFHIIKGVQIGDPNVNKESSLGKSKGKTMHKV